MHYIIWLFHKLIWCYAINYVFIFAGPEILLFYYETPFISIVAANISERKQIKLNHLGLNDKSFNWANIFFQQQTIPLNCNNQRKRNRKPLKTSSHLLLLFSDRVCISVLCWHLTCLQDKAKVKSSYENG